MRIKLLDFPFRNPHSALRGECPMFLQQVVGGLATGSIYALVALGFILIFKATDVVNFAQGELMMVCAFFTKTIIDWLHPADLLMWSVVALLTIVFAALFGALLERVIVRPIMNAPVFSIVIATIGLSTLLIGVTGGIVWDWDTYIIESPFSKQPVTLGGVIFTPLDVGIVGVTLGLILLLTLYFKCTKVGTAMRATQQNKQTAALMGISVKRIFAGTWALSTMVSGVAGFLAAPILLIDTNMGFVVLKGFAGAVLGGWGSLPGAIVGGMLLGVMENLATVYLPSQVKHVAAFLVLLLVLLVKPDGLLGFSVKKV
jgi:branched-chain amino acid transport system permease protein